jgi:hypothetical protein
MTTKDLEQGVARLWLNENVRGALVMAVSVAVLIGISFGAMVVLTSPDGWVTKAAQGAVSGEQAPMLMSYDSAANPQR